MTRQRLIRQHIEFPGTDGRKYDISGIRHPAGLKEIDQTGPIGELLS